MAWWWLSFSGEEGNLGVVIAQGHSEEDAIARTQLLGVHPGGDDVFGVPVPEHDPVAVAEMEQWGVDRLISPNELVEAGYEKTSDLCEEERALLLAGVETLKRGLLQ